MNTNQAICQIEHHAMLFAFLSKHAITLCGEQGKEAILTAMTTYGNERGQRMALNAKKHGDPLTTMTNQAYGEWKPDYPGQMEFGQTCTEPTLQTYISKCAWCEAWEKHNITEFGKYYCVNVDNAVYQGFRSDFVCTPLNASMSWGGDCCRFDWGHPLSAEEKEALAEKKKALGTSCMKDFNFHTAHLLRTLTRVLTEKLGADGEKAVTLATAEFADTFGQEYVDVLATISDEEIYPF